jgi:hypothetical protein
MAKFPKRQERIAVSHVFVAGLRRQHDRNRHRQDTLQLWRDPPLCSERDRHRGYVPSEAPPRTAKSVGTPKGPCGFLSASSRRDSRSGVADRRHPLRRIGRPKPQSPSLCHPSWLVRRSKRLCRSGREEHYALLRTWLKCQSLRVQGALAPPASAVQLSGPARPTSAASLCWITAEIACRNRMFTSWPTARQQPLCEPLDAIGLCLSQTQSPLLRVGEFCGAGN